MLEPYSPDKAFFFGELGQNDQGCAFKESIEEVDRVLENLLYKFPLERTTEEYGYDYFDWGEYGSEGSIHFYNKKILNYIDTLEAIPLTRWIDTRYSEIDGL